VGWVGLSLSVGLGLPLGGEAAALSLLTTMTTRIAQTALPADVCELLR